jgi:hypothetical protein
MHRTAGAGCELIERDVEKLEMPMSCSGWWAYDDDVV